MFQKLCETCFSCECGSFVKKKINCVSLALNRRGCSKMTFSGHLYKHFLLRFFLIKDVLCEQAIAIPNISLSIVLYIYTNMQFSTPFNSSPLDAFSKKPPNQTLSLYLQYSRRQILMWVSDEEAQMISLYLSQIV
jgi:hypothetical protein